MREYLVRLIYCEMLGHSASDCYAEAVKFAQQPNNLDKRVGEFISLIKITPKISVDSNVIDLPAPKRQTK